MEKIKKILIQTDFHFKNRNVIELKFQSVSRKKSFDFESFLKRQKHDKRMQVQGGRIWGLCVSEMLS